MGINWDVEETKPEFELLPAGKYLAEIRKVENLATKKGDGHYWRIEYCLLGDKVGGRRVWENYNYDNPNPKAVNIAVSQMKILCRVVGVDPRVFEKDQDVILGKELKVKLGVEKGKGDYPDRNKVVDFEPVGQLPPQLNSPQVQSAANIFGSSDSDTPF